MNRLSWLFNGERVVTRYCGEGGVTDRMMGKKWKRSSDTALSWGEMGAAPNGVLRGTGGIPKPWAVTIAGSQTLLGG